jgi:tetratricopeptide (TPR) repeat protein
VSPEVAICYANLAVDTLHQGNYQDAEQLANKAIEIWSQGPSDKAETDLAYNTLARIELHAGNYSAALKHIQLAVQVYDQRGKNNPLRLSAYQHTLALAKQGTGDPEGAAQAYQASLGTIAKMNATLSIQRIVILEDYAALLRTMGQKHESRELKRRAAKELAQLGSNNTLKYSVDVNALLSNQR